MSETKYYSIKTTENMKDDILASMPVLADAITEMRDNEYLLDVYQRCVELLNNAWTCKEFNIWDKNSLTICDWAYIESVEAIDQGSYGDRVEFDPPKKLLRVEWPTGAAIFRGDQTYYERFIKEVDRETKPDYHCWGFGTFFYEPENARNAVEKIAEIKGRYMAEIDKRQKERKIEYLEKERVRIDKAIAKLQESEDNKN